MADQVRQLRNLFFLGSYKQAIVEAENVLKTDPFNNQAQTLMFRSMIYSNPGDVFKKIPQSGSTALQAIKLLATYNTANEENREMVFDTLKDWLSSDEVASDSTLQAVAAQIFMEEGNYKEALRLLLPAGENLEKQALSVQLYLKINRVDLAVKVVKAMQDQDDDDILSQLATIWVSIAEGGEKLNEATFLLQDLVEKFGPSVLVLNCQATCQINQHNYSNAFQFLKQARDLAVAAGAKPSADTLVNSIVVLQLLKKSPEIVRKITSELTQCWPEHPWLKQQSAAEAQIKAQAATYSWKS